VPDAADTGGRARQEIRIKLEELVDRFESLTFDGPIERFRTHKHAEVTHMPLRFTLPGAREVATA
jgi:hypothetical protein